MTKKTYKTENTRKHIRMNAGYLIKYHLASEPEESAAANLKDFSAGGLKFWTEKPFNEGDLLEVSLWLPPLQRVVDVVCKVVRVRRAYHSDVYYVGAKYHHVTSEDQKRINDFIESISHRKRVPKSLIHDKDTVTRSKFLELIND